MNMVRDARTVKYANVYDTADSRSSSVEIPVYLCSSSRECENVRAEERVREREREDIFDILCVNGNSFEFIAIELIIAEMLRSEHSETDGRNGRNRIISFRYECMRRLIRQTD